MGFSMIKTKDCRKKFRIISQIALTLLLASCKLPDLESIDPTASGEFDPKKISEVLRPELSKISAGSIELEQMVKYESNYRLENSSKINILFAYPLFFK